MQKINLSELTDTSTIETVIKQGELLEQIFSVRESGIDSKIFHSWKIAGFLSTVEKGKWARLSFIDLLWLQTLESMRKFGCSHKIMKAIHEELFTKAYKENLAKIKS